MTDSPPASSVASDASKGALFVLFLVTFIDMIGFGIVIPFITYLVEDITPASQSANVGIFVGLLMASYSLAQFLFAPFWGSLSDRIGRRPVLLIGLIGNTVFFTLFGLANTLFIAFSARFLAGVFNGNLAVARAYIGDVSEPQQLATRMGLIGAAFGLGFTFGPFIGGELSDPATRWGMFQDTLFETYPYLLPCIAASLLSVFSLFVALRMLPESLPPEDRNITEKKSWVGEMNQIFRNTVSMLNSSRISIVIWISVLFSFGFTIMHAIFIFYTKMPIEDGGLAFSVADNGRVFAMIGITGIITQLAFIGPLTRKFGSRNLIPIASSMTGIGLFLIPYTQYEYGWVQILLVSGLIAMGNGLFTPSTSSFLTRIAKEEGYELGVVMGAQESVGALARILGPITGGFVWYLTASRPWPFDYHTAFHLCGLVMLIASLLALRMPQLAEDENS